MLKFLARAAIASPLIYGGQAAVREPGGRGKAVQKLSSKFGVTLADREADTVVKLNGMVMTGAGITFALGICRRLSAVALIGSLAATTVGGHPFWEESEPQTRGAQRTQFLKNVGIIGGLLLVLIGGKSCRTQPEE